MSAKMYNFAYGKPNKHILQCSQKSFIDFGLIYKEIHADNTKMIIGGVSGLAFIIGVSIGLYSLLLA